MGAPITGSGGDTCEIRAKQRIGRNCLFFLRTLAGLCTVGIKIKRLDESTEFHYHKWNAFVLIFGAYFEELEGDTETHFRVWWNRVYAFRAHRVIVQKPTWMIYFHGPIINHDHKNYRGAKRESCDD